MTSPPRKIQVECPKCGTTYDDWYRPSINLDLEGWDENDPDVKAYLRQASTATCPSCGHTVELDVLVVREGVWRFSSPRE